MSEFTHDQTVPSQPVIELAGQAASAAFAENQFAHLRDPDAPDPGFTVEGAAVRTPKAPVSEVSAWVDRSIAATHAALNRSDGTETQYFKVPPKA